MSSSQNGPSAEMNGGTAEEDEASSSKTGPTGSVMDGGRGSSSFTAPLGQNEPSPPNLTVSKVESAISQETRRESMNTPAGSEGTNLSRNSSKVDSPPASKKRRLSVINKVMKRMELAKLQRTFRSRIQLAAFKAERGWQGITLDVIEPHLEQEAASRRRQEEQHFGQHENAAGQFNSDAFPPLLQQQQQYLPTQSGTAVGSMGPPVALTSSFGVLSAKKGRSLSGGGSVADPSMANTSMYDHFVVPSSSHPSNNASGEISYAGVFSTPVSSYVSNLQYPNTAPLASTSTSTFSAAHASPTVAPAHKLKRRSTTAADNKPAFRTGSHATPPASSRKAPSVLEHVSQSAPRVRSKKSHTSSSSRRSMSDRPTPNGNNVNVHGTTTPSPNQQPLSSSDPNFSSFVDAASVLSGLSRGPSDSGIPGGEESDGRVPIHDPASHCNNTIFNRTQTPPPRSGGGVGAGSVLDKTGKLNESNPADAAELMLFLAASPSPVQARPPAIITNSLRGLEGMKGRRLFSNGSEDLVGGELEADEEDEYSGFKELTNGVVHLSADDSGDGGVGVSGSPFSFEFNNTTHHLNHQDNPHSPHFQGHHNTSIFPMSGSGTTTMTSDSRASSSTNPHSQTSSATSSASSHNPIKTSTLSPPTSTSTLLSQRSSTLATATDHHSNHHHLHHNRLDRASTPPPQPPRDRQPSFGGGNNWEAYLNVSPEQASKKERNNNTSMMGAAGDLRSGENGDTKQIFGLTIY